MVNSLTRYTCVLTLTLSLVVNPPLHAMNAQARAAHEPEYIIPLHILEQQLEPFMPEKKPASLIAEYALLRTSDAKKANRELEEGIANDNYELVSSALKCFAYVNAQMNGAKSYLEHCITSNTSYAIIEELLKHNANPNALTKLDKPLLHEAETIGITQLILKYEADINSVDTAGNNVLFTINEGLYNHISTLIAHRADVHHRNKQNETPLHIAARKHDPILAQKLLQTKANANVVDNKGNTPLHHLAWGNRTVTSRRIIRLLLKANANPLAKNNDDQSPFDLCGFSPSLKALIAEEYDNLSAEKIKKPKPQRSCCFFSK